MWIEYLLQPRLCKQQVKYITSKVKRQIYPVTLSCQHMKDESTDHTEPPIILLHGLLGYKWHFRSMAKTLLTITKRSIIIPDLRNHGDSPHAKSNTYEELAEDVYQVMQKQKIDKAIFIGHSIGGRTSMTLALTEPEKVAGLVILDTSPVSNCSQFTESYPKILKAMLDMDFSDLKDYGPVKVKHYAKSKLNSIIDDELTMKVVLSNLHVKRKLVRWKCNVEMLLKNFESIIKYPPRDLNKFSGPTLFIGGQKSDFLPFGDIEVVWWRCWDDVSPAAPRPYHLKECPF